MKLIDKLDKNIIYIRDKHLYSMNKHHTLLMRFQLKTSHPEMCFQSSSWVPGATFYRDKEGNFKVREDSIILTKNKEIISIPRLKINLEKEYETLSSVEMEKILTIETEFFQKIASYSGLASFCKLETTKDTKKVSLYDTSKGQMFEYATRTLLPQKKEGKWYLPVEELKTAYSLGFNNSEVWDAKDYLLLKDKKKTALISSMVIE